MIKELKEALQIILKQPSEGLIAYAQTYAQACFDLGDVREAKVITNEFMIDVISKKTNKEMVGKELRVQLLYVLCNLDEWHSKEAQRVKNVIKKYTKKKEIKKDGKNK